MGICAFSMKRNEQKHFKVIYRRFNIVSEIKISILFAEIQFTCCDYRDLTSMNFELYAG